MLLKNFRKFECWQSICVENNKWQSLLLKCGVMIRLRYINFSKAQGLIIISHAHNDHCPRKNKKFGLAGIDIYDHSNLVAGKTNKATPLNFANTSSRQRTNI